jgi:hypothetical protein
VEATAIEHLSSRRLLIRFSQPDRVAIVKEQDGQIKTPEDGKDSNKRMAPITKSTARMPLSFTYVTDNRAVIPNGKSYQ